MHTHHSAFLHTPYTPHMRTHAQLAYACTQPSYTYTHTTYAYTCTTHICMHTTLIYIHTAAICIHTAPICLHTTAICIHNPSICTQIPLMHTHPYAYTTWPSYANTTFYVHTHFSLPPPLKSHKHVCVCVCVRACVRACASHVLPCDSILCSCFVLNTNLSWKFCIVTEGVLHSVNIVNYTTIVMFTMTIDIGMFVHEDYYCSICL